jgi:photosystem II stability/assembly factor-like uncharacterized protein
MRRRYRWLTIALLCPLLALAGCGEAATTATPADAAAATPLAATPTSAPNATPSLTAPTSTTVATPSLASPTAPATPAGVATTPPPVTDGITNTVTATVATKGSGQTSLTDLAFADARNGWMLSSTWTFGSTPGPVATILATTDGGKTWIKQLQGQDITDIEAASATHVWAVQENTLLFSTDGGRRWQKLQSGILPDRVMRIEFSDQDHGWAAGYGSGGKFLLYRTINGGQEWEQSAGTSACSERGESGQLSFVTPLVGWMLCEYGGAGGSTPKALYKTEDGAQTWTLLTESTRERRTPHGLPLASGTFAFFFINETEGWHSGLYGTLTTTDGGLTWRSIALPSWSPDAGFRWVRFVSRDHGYAVISGSYITLLETTDGGAQWTPIYTTNIWPSGIIHFTGRTTGVAAGTPLDAGTVLRTSDGGESWQPVGKLGSPTTKILQFTFTDASNGWAYSYHSGSQQQPHSCAIHRTTDGGATWRQLPAPQSPDLICGEFGVSLHFVDRQTGFLAHATPGGSRLLVTRDGGERFQSLTTFPSALKQLDFADANTGWAITGEGIGADIVVATDDGGRTWRTLPRNYRIPWTSTVYQGTQNGVPVNPIPPTYGANAPNLFPNGVAWLIVSVFDPMQGVNLLLSTADGGKSWTHHKLEEQPGGATQGKVARTHFGAPQFIDLDHGWLTSRDHLYRTTDGGRTWVQLR